MILTLSFITYYVSTLKDWTEWVNEDMAQSLVDLFGILLALTVLFGPTAGVLIDFITKKLVLKVHFKQFTFLDCHLAIFDRVDPYKRPSLLLLTGFDDSIR